MCRRLPLSLLAMLLLGGAAQATPSFEKVYSVPVNFNGTVQSVTVHQDHADPKTFFYLPRKPRLTMTMRDGKPVPQYRFQRFQFKDPENANGLLEGAVMQFAVNLAMSGAELDEIKNGIKSQVMIPDPKDPTITRPIDLMEINLKQIPIRDSVLSVYDPVTGEKLGKGLPPALSPTTLNADIPFTVKMDVISAQLANKLTEGTTGISCAFVYNYDVISEAAGFKITVNWSKVFDHYSKHTEEAEKIRSGWWIFSSNSEDKKTSTTTLTESLVNSSAVVVDVTSSKAFPADKLNGYMQPVLDAITKELGGDATPKVDPAKADAATAESNQGGLTKNTNTVEKTIKITTSGTRTWNFNAREVFSITQPASGFIEVGAFMKDPAIKRLLVPDTVTDENYESARISLPVLSTSKAQGITSVTLQVMATDGKTTDGKNEMVTWTPNDKVEGGLGAWRYGSSKAALGMETDQLTFGLETFRNKLGDAFKQKMGFRVISTVDYKIGTDSGTIYHKAIVPMFNGNVPLFQPLNHLGMVEIDPALMDIVSNKEEGISIVDLTIVTPTGAFEPQHLKINRLTKKFLKDGSAYQFPVKVTDGMPSYTVTAKLVGRANGKVTSINRTGTLTQGSLYLDSELVNDPDWFKKQETETPVPAQESAGE